MTKDDGDAIGTYVGWPHWVADWKVRLGRWLETRRGDDTGLYTGFETFANLKTRFGQWLEEHRGE